MKRKFLVPVVSAISVLLGHQANAALSPPTPLIDVPADGMAANATSHSLHASEGTALSEFPVFDKGNEYLFLMQRSESGALIAYHSSHRSHSSHSSHSSHYSSR